MRPLRTIALLALASCGGPPPPPPPTVVNVTVTADPAVNGSAPVAIRLYQLASPTGFDGAQFFALFNKDTATLGPDLVKKDDFILAPGATKQLTLTLEDRVHAIGIFAAYRDVDHATWRADAAPPPHQTSSLEVTAGPAGLTAKLAPAQTGK